MQDKNFPKKIQLSNDKVANEAIIFKLIDEVTELRRVNEETVNILSLQKEIIQELRNEIARLKKQNPKPDIPSSNLEGPKSKPNWRKKIGPRNDQMKIILFSTWMKKDYLLSTMHSYFSLHRIITPSKRLLSIIKLASRVIKKTKRRVKPGQPRGKSRQKKNGVLKIHEKRHIELEKIPEGAEFKGYQKYTVQELSIKPHNIQYKVARWKLPNGKYITAKLPENIQGHYGPELLTHILHQYYSCRVTEHLLLDQLRAYGVLISAGQLNNILIENKEIYIEEVAELLPLAAKLEGQIQADDTSGRHKGKNQYTTVIGNDWFSLFATTDSKSRINFLKLLQNGKEEYLINQDTLEYLSKMNVSSYFPGYVALSLGKKFTSSEDWECFLTIRNITSKNEVRFLTQAALYASLIANGIPKDLGIHSDDAGQFDLFIHSLCWIHEERHYGKLIMTTDESQSDLKRVEKQIWHLYAQLKEYKKDPTEDFKSYLDQKFDEIFQQKTSSALLNKQLSKTHKKKLKLLRVLERPNTPLHNNSSETDARSAKMKLKISGGTRSDTGQLARDTFLSLQQTCRKLSIKFMDFLRDRVQGFYKIPRLAQVIHDRMLKPPLDPPDQSCLSKN